MSDRESRREGRRGDGDGGMTERFPALERLGVTPEGSIPYIAQTTATDCGPACIAMVLGLHGRVVRLDEVREVAGHSIRGTDAQALLDTARHYHLRGRGVQVADPADLAYLGKGAILHWRFNHFVVFERLTPRGAWVVDPAFGRRLVPMDELGVAFTGVALDLQPTEEFETGGERSRGVWRYARKVLGQSGLLTRVLVTSVMIQLFALAVPLLTGVLVDRVVPRQDVDLLLVLAVGFAALVGFQLLASLIRSFLLLHLRTRLDSVMTLEFLEHLVRLPYLFFQQRSTGDLMMRLNSNTTIREILTASALSGVLDGAMVSLYLVLLLVADWRLGLLVLTLGALRVLLYVFTRRRHRDLTSEGLHAQAMSRGYQVQLLAGIETLKASGSERQAVEHWSNLFVDELNVTLRRGRLDAVVNSLLAALGTGSPLLILLFGGYLVIQGDLTLGTMLALAALAGGFLGPLSTLVTNAYQLQSMGSYLDRINDVLETSREQEGREVRSLGRLAGRIELEDVTFRYGPLAEPAVDGVSLTIEAGQLVAVVGASGSGKSTLAGLLAGLYEPESGRILYDGVDLSEIDLPWLRSQFGFVAQQPYLFGMSVRANIALANPSLPLSRVVEAARLAEIHRDIVSTPMGYESALADGGMSLSGGQRQRIAIARALVHRPTVLILDEATSSLDAVTERRIQDNLSHLSSTRVVIAHRLSTVRHADAIVVMEDGQIVEQGSHGALLDLNGRYARLVAAQMEKT